MAFCTNCGATVNGVFCTQCGRPVGSAAPPPPAAPPVPPVAGYQPPPMAQPPFPPVPPPMIPGGRKTSPVVWVLVILLGLFVVSGVVVVGAGFFIAHKVRQAGFDPELMAHNPGLAISKLVAAANPDVQVLNTDDAAGTITVRDKRTGKVTTLTFDQAKNGRFSVTARDDQGKNATLEFGGSAKGIPDWVPSYPGGSEPKGTFSASSDNGKVGGSFTFTTTDSADRVMSFYQDKFKELGFKTTNISSPSGGSVIGADDATKRSLLVFVGNGSPTSVSVTYSVK
ncbi:MAG: hypothetical protein ACLQVN_25345 [Bryobacteraceae bacterium]